MSSEPFRTGADEVASTFAWLQTRGVPKKGRTVQIKELLDYASTWGTASAVKDTDFEGIIERSVRVYRAHLFSQQGGGLACEAERERRPPGEHTFTHAEFPGYDDPAQAVLRMVDDPRTLVQRSQLSGLCYMHAPAVVQYYSIWHALFAAGSSQAEPQHGMLDLTWYIANRFADVQLERYIFDDTGGSSVRFLYDILLPGSTLRRLAPADAMAGLRQYGPALASQFHVFDDFTQATVHKHHVPPAAATIEVRSPNLHAMVLVGARVDPAKGRFFLLQNWWEGKQFVEVSEEYLTASRAVLVFVATPQTAVSRELHTHSPRMHYAETERVMEKAERMPLERA